MLVLLTIATVLGQAPAEAAESRQSVIVVVGAAGEEEYRTAFTEWHQRWQTRCEQAGVDFRDVGTGGSAGKSDLDALLELLGAEPRGAGEPLWLVLIGHGTYDGRKAKFNLRGPDLTASQLAAALKPLERTVVVINCASASSPFLNALAGENRVVVTATKSGYQYNYARFGDYFSRAVGDAAADLDKDGQTSVLEAYLLASARVAEFYRQEARLATEQALLDDNGDGLGTPATWFRGVRVVEQSKSGAAADGLLANQVHLLRTDRERNMPPDQRARRDELERQIAELRQQKAALPADDYYARLLPIMLELARLYE